MNRREWIIVGILGPLAWSCGQAPGRFEVRFSFADEAPAQSEFDALWVHVSIEERPEPNVSGPTLSSAVSQMALPLQVSLDSVPNGENRVVVAEIRDSIQRMGSSVLYFGLSDSFSLEPGDDKDVNVRLQLAPAPGPPADGSAPFLEVVDARQGRVNSPDVMLRVTASDADTILLAKDAQFSVGLDVLDAPPPEVGTASSTPQFLVPYDLNSGICEGEDCDGLRTIFAKVVNEQGYESKPGSVQVTLDTTAPRVVDAVFSPSDARLGITAFLTVTLDEQLEGEAEAQLLLWEGPDPGFVFAERSGLNYSFELPVDNEVSPGIYQLDGLKSRDNLGNEAVFRASPLPLLFSVDSEAPRVTDLDVTPDRTSGSTVAIAFGLSEDVGASGIGLSIGGRIVAAEQCSLSGSAPAITVSCAYSATGNETPVGTESTQTVLVEARDSAGNSASESANLTFDFRNPDIGLATVAYIPESNNPLAAPTAAKAGTAISVTLVFDEPIDVSMVPTLSATNSTTTINNFSLVQGTLTEGGARFVATVPASATDGVYTPSIVLTDRAGNTNSSATFGTPQINIKTSTPALAVDQSLVSFVRAPIGNAAAESLGSNFTLPPGPAYFALAPSDPLEDVAALPAATFAIDGAPSVLRAWAEAEKENLLATIRPESSGEWRRNDLQLANLDTPHVYVTGFDAAGNESAPVVIENTWFVASSAAPSIGGSPHLLLTSGRPTAPLENATVVPSRDAVRAPDAAAEIRRAEHAWQRRDGQNLVGRLGHAMAYDSARDRVVLFGGLDGGGGGMQSDTWEWDGHSWDNVTPALNNPLPRRLHALTYDSARGRVVMFGGLAITGAHLSDTWEWDGTRWRDLTPSANNPVARRSHALAYDSARERTILFGGTTGGIDYLADTWQWDGLAWTQMMSGASSPDPREHHALAYDSVRERIVLFGGRNFSSDFSDTWVWDGIAWSDVSPAINSPTERYANGMAYDSARQRVVLFGGYSLGSFASDTWEWDGMTWSEVSPTSEVPPPRFGKALVYNAARGRVVLFSGSTNVVSLLSDTWEWDGAAWSNRTPSTINPLQRSGHGMAYDASRGRVVMFGGYSSNLVQPDTWEWDGSTWTDVTPATNNPTPRGGHRMVFDSARNRVLLFGGTDLTGPRADTWEWNGSAWSDVTPTLNNPPPRSEHGLAFDTSRGRAVLFGGRESVSSRLADTWEWDGAAWSNLTPASNNPVSRVAHRLGFDEARNRVVLFGGVGASGSLADTWEWNGTAWTNVTPAVNNPPSRVGHSLVFDSVRGRLVLNGGLGATAVRLADTWEWNGSTWRDISPSVNNVGARSGHAMVFDSARGRALMFGGFNEGASLQDTWELSPPTRPAIQFAAQLPPELPRNQLTGVRVRASCGGLFDAGGEGAVLFGWLTGGPGRPPGEWLELSSNTTASPTPAAPIWAGLMDYQPAAADAVLFAQALFEADGRMFFQCRSDGDSGNGFAEVALDYIEVRVRYTAD